MIIKFTWHSRWYGCYPNDKESIMVDLTALGDGSHDNDGIVPRHLFGRYTEDQIIKDVVYTINHEVIHLAQDILEDVELLEAEYIVYNMIGNGGNGGLNRYFNIKKNKKWEKIIES